MADDRWGRDDDASRFDGCAVGLRGSDGGIRDGVRRHRGRSRAHPEGSRSHPARDGARDRPRCAVGGRIRGVGAQRSAPGTDGTAAGSGRRRIRAGRGRGTVTGGVGGDGVGCAGISRRGRTSGGERHHGCRADREHHQAHHRSRRARRPSPGRGGCRPHAHLRRRRPRSLRRLLRAGCDDRGHARGQHHDAARRHRDDAHPVGEQLRACGVDVGLRLAVRVPRRGARLARGERTHLDEDRRSHRSRSGERQHHRRPAALGRAGRGRPHDRGARGDALAHAPRDRSDAQHQRAARRRRHHGSEDRQPRQRHLHPAVHGIARRRTR